MADLTRLSKFLSLMLRHKADEFGLELDSEGFTDYAAVWQQVQKRYGRRYSAGDLAQLVAESARFERRGDRIRARYGHGAVSDVTYPAAEPPETLYHGTVAGVLDAIRQEGLTAQGRQYVHLSTTPDRADEVAGRRGKPVLLRIRTREAQAAGIVFYQPEERHYLAKAIPPQFIDFPE